MAGGAAPVVSDVGVLAVCSFSARWWVSPKNVTTTMAIAAMAVNSICQVLARPPLMSIRDRLAGGDPLRRPWDPGRSWPSSAPGAVHSDSQDGPRHGPGLVSMLLALAGGRARGRGRAGRRDCAGGGRGRAPASRCGAIAAAEPEDQGEHDDEEDRPGDPTQATVRPAHIAAHLRLAVRSRCGGWIQRVS